MPSTAPAFAREAERRLPAVALAEAGGASRHELRLASQPYQRRRSNDGLRQCDTSICSRAWSFQIKLTLV